MNQFDYDRQFRLMELAESEEETKRLSAEMRAYIEADPERQTERRAEWSAAIDRLLKRSEIELNLMRQLLGQPVTV